MAGHGLLSHDLNLIRAQRKQFHPERSGVVSGDTEAVLTGEDGDNYVKIHKNHHEEGEEEKNEGEEEKGE